MSFPPRAVTDTFLGGVLSQPSLPFRGSVSSRCHTEELLLQKMQRGEHRESAQGSGTMFKQALRELERAHDRELAALRHVMGCYGREGAKSPPRPTPPRADEFEVVCHQESAGSGYQQCGTDQSNVSDESAYPVDESGISNGHRSSTTSMSNLPKSIGGARRTSMTQLLQQEEEQRQQGNFLASAEVASGCRLAALPNVPQNESVDSVTWAASLEEVNKRSTMGESNPDGIASGTLTQSHHSDHGQFVLRSWWRGELARGVERKISFSRRSGGATTVARAQSEHSVQTRPRWRKFALHPNCAKRLIWDMMSMSLLTYDIMAIPFVSAFEPPLSPFLEGMTLGTLIFWTTDMPVSALTGYQKGKEVILDPTKTALHYFKTWFALDTLIVVLDFLMLFLFSEKSDVDSNDGSAFRLGRTLRTLRFVRTLRLIRVLKLKRIVQAIQDSINTEAVSIVFGVCKIIVFLIIANHVVACGWYSVAYYSVDNQGRSWANLAGMSERSIAYRYMTSLHWSLTQFTPASMEVVPENTGERIFTVIVILFAMIAFSSFVSLLTASMAQLQALSSNESRQFWLLRRYLRDWGVRRSTSLRVQRYLEYAYQKQRLRVQEGEVKLLSLLSEPLRLELKHETFSQYLSGHPLFLVCSEQARVFGKALAAMSLASNDLIFACGEQARMVTFLTSGMLEYTIGLHENHALDSTDSQMPQAAHRPREHLPEGMWVCEVVLWTEWFHLGDLLALTECQVVTVSASTFAESVQTSAPLWSALRTYAAKFLENLNNFEVDDLTDLTSQLFSPEEAITRADFQVEARAEEKEDEESSYWMMMSGFARRASQTVSPNDEAIRAAASAMPARGRAADFDGAVPQK